MPSTVYMIDKLNEELAEEQDAHEETKKKLEAATSKVCDPDDGPFSGTRAARERERACMRCDEGCWDDLV